MQITQDEYAYVYVKLAILKNIIMKQQDLQRLQSYSDLNSLKNFIDPFYPDFKPLDLNAISIERELWRVYFKIIERILAAAPTSIQNFLQIYLLKWEIWNIKVNLLGIISGVSPEQRMNIVIESPSKLIGRKDFLLQMIKAKTISEFEKASERTPYGRIIKEKLADYNKTHEIFWLECQLDKFYNLKLLESLESYGPEEQQFLSDYITSIIDYYNINLIYRGLFNKIPPKLFKDYIIPKGRFLRGDAVKDLVNSSSVEDFLARLKKGFTNKKLGALMMQEFQSNSPESLERVKRMILRMFYRISRSEFIGDIPLSSMARIFDIVLNKEFEIQEIMASVVRIISLQKRE